MIGRIFENLSKNEYFHAKKKILRKYLWVDGIISIKN